MKLLYCQECGDIIAPYRQANRPRSCECGLHAVWWTDPQRGILKLHCLTADWIGSGVGDSAAWYPRQPRAYVIGLTNVLLMYDGSLSAEVVKEMIDLHEDTYLFKKWRSLVIRVRPGESNDTSWSRTLP